MPKRVLSSYQLLGLLFLFFCFFPGAAQAHLMPAGKGTLNLIGPKAYLVLSLPMSSLGLSSEGKSFGVAEYEQRLMRAAIRQRIQLHSNQGVGELEEIIFSLADQQALNGQPAHQHELVAMIVARFPLPPQRLTFYSTLLLQGAEIQIKATMSQGRQTLKSEFAFISGNDAEAELFASPLSRLKSSGTRGFSHLLLGVDHLLFFLLLFLIAPPSLTLFASLTLGLLTASILAGSLPQGGLWLELLVALTLLLVAVNHSSLRGRGRILGFVAFSGALIHGLAFTQTNLSLKTQDAFQSLQWLGLQLGLGAGVLLLALVAFLFTRFILQRSKTSQQQIFRYAIVTIGLISACYYLSLRSLLLAGIIT